MSPDPDWDRLHADPRHQLHYPSEHVVRWLARTIPQPTHRGERPALGVDIGCGGGRHVLLLKRACATVDCVDTSDIALAHCRRVSGVQGTVADMTALPWHNDTVDIAIAYGVYYYGTRDDHRHAVAELRRVLAPGGRALVNVRSENDWRAQHTHDDVFSCDNEPEDGMQMTFTREGEVLRIYSGFAELTYELTATTENNRSRINSDWLIEVTK